MGLRKTIKRISKDIFGHELGADAPRGVNVFNDLKKDLPKLRISNIFDVGANIGQSAREFALYCPDAKVHCFEPIGKTFTQLNKNTEKFANVHCYKIALSATNGDRLMHSVGKSSKNFLLSAEEENGKEKEVLPNGEELSSDDKQKNLETVESMTLEQFCHQNDIPHISYLKVDTEGADLEVIQGAEGMISRGQIDIIEVESGMHPNNKYHVPMESFKSFLEARQYYVFGIYEQTREWTKKEPHLRRANILFISQALIDQHRK